jgi:carboxyl-terminal processing protease
MVKSHSALFDQVWQTVNNNFYDPNFNGVDWEAMKSKYEPKVTQAQSSEEVAALVNQMLGELKTSHTHFYTPNEPAYYQILGIFAPRSSELQQQLKRG